jgi:hypothetical protein
MSFPAAGLATADNQLNGQQKVQVVDAVGASAGGPRTPTLNTTLANYVRLATGAGKLYSARITLESTLSGRVYLLVVDSAENPPADALLTILDFEALDTVSGSLTFYTFDDDRLSGGLAFTTGCGIALSTTFPSMTKGSAAMWVRGRI